MINIQSHKWLVFKPTIKHSFFYQFKVTQSEKFIGEFKNSTFYWSVMTLREIWTNKKQEFLDTLYKITKIFSHTATWRGQISIKLVSLGSLDQFSSISSPKYGQALFYLDPLVPPLATISH